jgi:membrane-associated phospholipid phosphatase
MVVGKPDMSVHPSRYVRVIAGLTLVTSLAASPAYSGQDVSTPPGSPDAVQVASTATEQVAPPGKTQLQSLTLRLPSGQGESSVPTSYLITGLKDDLKRLPSKWTAYSIATGATLALAVHPSDSRFAGGDADPPKFRSFFNAGQAAGSGYAQYGGAIATFVAAKIAGNYEAQVIGADLVRAQLLTASVTYALKGAVRRERPDGGSYSFPSGHAATSFATATVLWNRLGWKAGLPAYALATYIAVSRVPDKRHWASDVAVGSAIGLSVGQAVSRSGSKRLAIAPLVAPGIAGVQVSKIW